MIDLTIYGLTLSTFVRTTLMSAIEKGIAFDRGITEFGDMKSDEHLEMNPFGKIPVMRHGDFVLYESVAICRYLDSAFEGPALQPSDPQQRALMDQWVSIVNSYIAGHTMGKLVGPYLFPKGKDGGLDREKIEKSKPKVGEHLGLLEAAYDGRDFLVGDTATMADFAVAPVLHYISLIPEGPDLLAPFPNVCRGLDALRERKSFQETLPPPIKSPS
jgi:glutathione S-transferase